MEQVYSQEQIIVPSKTDAAGLLSIQDTFSLFMDLASIHAEKLGIGLASMTQKGLFWLTVKTQICFHARPSIMESVTARTWPEQPGKMRGNRSYQILRGDQVLIAGKTEWAIYQTKTGRLMPIAGIYPEELCFSVPTACPEPFARIPDDFGEQDSFAEYRVRPTDIDIGGHMNNTAYIRALLGCCSVRTLSETPIRRIDVVYRSPCYEGDQLRFQKRESEGAVEIRGAKGDETALLVRVEPQN